MQLQIQAVQAGLSLEQFWVLTPFEFQIHRMARLASEKEEWHRAAFIAATVANCWAEKGKGTTPERLLGWRKKIAKLEVTDFRSRGEYYRHLARTGAEDGD